MEMNSLGLVELSSIASGMQAADIMLKTSKVELILSRTICSGKYMVLIGGLVAEVQSAVDAAVRNLEYAVIDTFVIPNVHKDIFPALAGHSNVETLEALGIIEAFSVASLIEGADAAVKAAKVRLIEIRLAMALGGKAFCTLTGEVAAVTSAVDSGAKVIADRGLLVNKVVIPQPRKELLSEMI
ncbi:MAG: propanediol utilization protein [Ignavibacteria bacterium RBG_13_36_8]|nr:MAG: propanediol utilization protein [Ignavibacteria bacterium RBG_13_36_8]